MHGGTEVESWLISPKFLQRVRRGRAAGHRCWGEGLSRHPLSKPASPKALPLLHPTVTLAADRAGIIPDSDGDTEAR